VGGINLLAMRKLQLLGDLAMRLVFAGVLSLGLVIFALLGLLAVARALILEAAQRA
jgi:hypothetical protein